MTHTHRKMTLATEDTRNEARPPATSGIEPVHAAPAAEPMQIAGVGGSLAEERVIGNPISGERIIIRESGAQTGGRLLAFDLFLPPGGHVPARHVHPVQEERFTVVAGVMRFRLGRFGHRVILAHPGETILVPAGTAHWFGNSGTQIAHARVEVRPALRTEELFEMTEAIGRTGYSRGDRLPRLTDLARVVLEFQREVAAPDVPAVMVKILLAPLVWLGRRRERAPGPVGRPGEHTARVCAPRGGRHESA